MIYLKSYDSTLVFWASRSMGMMSSSHGCGNVRNTNLEFGNCLSYYIQDFLFSHKPHLKILTRNWDLRNLNGCWYRRETISPTSSESVAPMSRETYISICLESLSKLAGNMSYMHLYFLKLFAKHLDADLFVCACMCKCSIVSSKVRSRKRYSASTTPYYMQGIFYLPKAFPNLLQKGSRSVVRLYKNLCSK